MDLRRKVVGNKIKMLPLSFQSGVLFVLPGTRLLNWSAAQPPQPFGKDQDWGLRDLQLAVNVPF